MRKELVEILSDASNNAVLRHPNRSFPGSLIQGDSLHALICDVDEAKRELNLKNFEEVSEILGGISEALHERMRVYKAALKENSIALPFNDS
ncbi:DUF6959 family protein [Undibacterium fentianense]|uniref:Uncharacterized protein n=1 Tax=Undibacterium fentianense TaxID=2828728 RepID=A0A941E2M7_9BURK|nr:hypothetical protein [Undibacterium fentianense]MBR7800107.1 hypothetical protein [Undibacterium fentianense]